MKHIYINGFPPIKTPDLMLETLTFGGGEINVKVKSNIVKSKPSFEGIDKSNEVTIFARANNSDDIMRILLTHNALEIMEFDKINLFLPYIPYARQDRIMDEGESFSLQIFANLINSCNFNRVTVYDPHSDVSPALIKKCNIITNYDFVNLCIEDINKSVQIPYKHTIVSPDSGAFKKIFKLTEHLNKEQNKYEIDEIILGNKVRDLKTGKILHFTVDKENIEGRDTIIIDDICSRGGTFIGLVKELKKRNVGKIYLIVSHYENCADVAQLKECGIERVYATQSIMSRNDDFVKSISFNELLNC